MAAERSAVGLFPSLAPDGGIEVSGRIACDALVDWAQGAAGAGTELIFFGPAVAADTVPGARSIASSTTKPGTIMACLRRRGPWDLALVWHLGMVKLLPFLRPRPRRAVLFLHGVEAWRPVDRGTVLLVRRRVDAILANSEFTWAAFQRANPSLARHHHRIVPLGVGARLDQPTTTPIDPPAALMLSRLHRGENYKGHRQLIQAWPRIRRRVEGAQLWIAGGGDLRADLERTAADSGVSDAVHFFGRVSEETKAELLSRCRCLLLPSRGEGFGLVYLEAMRVGRPCLVSHVDAGREVVCPPAAGLAADADDSDALTDAVCRLLTAGREWDRWSDQARRRYEARFTAAAFQARLCDALSP